jgi:transposase
LVKKKRGNAKTSIQALRSKPDVLLPPSIEELIEKNHPVTIVNEVIERINIEPLLREYKGGHKQL